MIMRINNSLEEKNRGKGNLLVLGRKGQHLSEFLLLFLAVAVAFGGMQFYMRRGVNAQFKQVEMKLGAATSSTSGANLDPCHHVWVRLINVSGQQVWRCNFDIHESALAKWRIWQGDLLQCCGTYSTLDPNNSTCALNNSAPFAQNGCAMCMNLSYGQTYYFKWNESGNDNNNDPQINIQRCCNTSCAATPLPCLSGPTCE
jgi:hypothetical protein